MARPALLRRPLAARRRPISLLEALEGRRLLSTTFPDLPNLDKPLGNPALPAGVHAFAPPVAATTPVGAAPDFADWIRSGGPNQTLSLTGDEFSTFAGNDFAKDTRFFVYGQTTSGNGVTKPSAIQRIDGPHAAITLDSTLPSDSMYFVWAQNNAGVSYPIAINQTEAWWVGFDQATRGETVSVYGRNLTSGVNGSTAHVYLTAPGSSTGVWATVTAANPYKVDFTVPASLANGQYEVWVHNGRGGQYGWSSPIAPSGARRLLTVRNALDWTGPSYNVKTQYGAVGDGVTDDRAAIQAAIADAAAHVLANPTSRPTVFLPAGTYQVNGVISTPANVRILGAGKDAGGNWLTAIRKGQGPRAVWNFDQNTNDLTRNNNHGTVVGTSAYVGGWKTTGAFNFDGATRVDFGSPTSLDLTGEITLAARFKTPSGAGVQTLVSRTGGGKSVFLRLNNNTIQFGYNDGSGEVFVSYNHTPNNNWVNFSGVYEGGQLRIYQSGTLRASLNHAGGVPAITGNWSAGANADGTQAFTGAIDAIRVYNRNTSPDEKTTWGNAWRETTSEPAVLDSGGGAPGSEVNGVALTTQTGSFIGEVSMGTAIVSTGGSDVTWRNIRISSGVWRAFSGGGTRFAILDSDIIGNTSFLSNSSMVRIDGVNFYGTYDAESFVASWDGEFISISNSTGQDFDPSNPNSSAGFAGGRFFVGSTPGGSQRYVYIGDITTTDLAARPLKGDQNAGEQILWDQNAGNIVTRTMVSATASTIRFNVTSWNNDHDIIIAGGKGVGQRRSVKSFDAATGTITLDKPWNVIPDASSIVVTGRVVANIAIYNNQLDGKSDYATRVTASSGVNVFNDAFDMVVDGNTINDVRTGINLNPVSQGSTRLPIYNTLLANNTITNTIDAIALLGSGDPTTQPALTNAVVRGNQATNMTERGLRAASGNMVVVENNSFSDTPQGIGNSVSNGMRVENLVVRNNTFNRGTATLAGSIGFVPINNNGTNITPALSGNTFTGFERDYDNFTTSTTHSGRVWGVATANNGKFYFATNNALGSTAVQAVNVFDPANPRVGPSTFLSATAGGPNGHLQNVRAIAFTNTTYAGPNENPVNCDMYLLNNGSGSVSKYTFDSAGTMTYVGEVVAGLGNAIGLAIDGSGNLLILCVDHDTITSGNQPRLYRWDGTSLSTLIDTPQFTYSTNGTIRNPGGVAVDAAGRIWISYSSVAGVRRFTSSGAFDADYGISANGGAIAAGPDGRVYVVTGTVIRVIDPIANTVGVYANSTTVPSLSGQSGVWGMGFARKTIADLDPNSGDTIIVGTTGNRFIGIQGPGGASAGSQLDFRENVYGIGDLTTRVIEISGTAGGTLNANLPLRNSGPVNMTYTLSEASPWLSITSNASGTLTPQQVANAGLSINTTGLAAGTYTADVTFNWSTLGASGTQKATVIVTVTGSGGGTGTLIEENFDYGSSNQELTNATANVDGLNGGSNWTSGWRRPGGGTQSDYANYLAGTGLQLTRTGYSNGSNGTGANVGAAGQSATMTRGDRYAYRTVAPLSGTVWVSALLRVTENNRPIGFGFDSTAYNPAARVMISNATTSTLYNGVTTSSSTGIGTNNTALAIFRLTVDASGANDRVEVWTNPADVSSIAALGTPTLDTGATADIFGTSLDVFSFNITRNTGAGGQLDAIRISDSFDLVTGGGGGGSLMMMTTSSTDSGGEASLAPSSAPVVQSFSAGHRATKPLKTSALLFSTDLIEEADPLQSRGGPTRLLV
jgi:hypothetical protein